MTGSPIPGLATSWKMLDDTTWELKLRPDVRFHNGEKFTADDVAFTIDRVPRVVNSPGSFAIYTRTFTEVIVVDPTTVRLKTAAIYPLVPVDLREVKIISRGVGANPQTDDFNSGKHAIGTGPYRRSPIATATGLNWNGTIIIGDRSRTGRK